jgi:DNA mismatch repair protein MLH3
VSIRDAFYNVRSHYRVSVVTLSESNKLPVRRRSHPNPTRTLELVKHTLEELALVCYGVAFTLDNLAINRNNLRKGRVLSIPKASQISISWNPSLLRLQSASVLDTFRHIYGCALAEVSTTCCVTFYK